MFTDIAGNQQGNDRPLNASNPADFKMIYDASMQLLFKISYRIVNDEEGGYSKKRNTRRRETR